MAGAGGVALGGGLSLVGALCYAELATTYARSGGDYEYLTQAYGRWAGFIFGWAQLVAVWTASVGTMAYTFGDYGVRLLGLESSATVWLAAAAVIAVAVVNMAGLAAGKWTQNVLTVAKVAGLTGVVVAGLIAAILGRGVTCTEIAPLRVPFAGGGSFGLAMVFVLYAYGGWNDAAFVAAEVRDRRTERAVGAAGRRGGGDAHLSGDERRRIWRRLGLTAAAVNTPAVDAVAIAVMGRGGRRSGERAGDDLRPGGDQRDDLTGSRVFAVFGADHRLFGWLGRDPRRAAPVAAIAAQSAVTLAMVFGVGTEGGRGAIDAAFRAVARRRFLGTNTYGGFETLLAATAPVFWALFLAVGIGLMVLRSAKSRAGAAV